MSPCPSAPVRHPFLALLSTVAVVTAQIPDAEPLAAIRAERVAEVLGYLASDRLAGRDSPSAGLEEAAQFLAWSFAKAGLVPGASVGDSRDWFHRYALPGVEFDTAGSSLTLTVDGVARSLRPGVDFRIWETGRAFEADAVPLDQPTPEADVDPRQQRRAMAGRTVTFFRVGTDDAAWRAAAGDRRIIRRRAAGGAPIVLIRSDAVSGPGTVAALRVPAPTDVDVQLKNVIGVLPGTDLADEYVLVSSHYDHVGVRPSANGGDGIYNGADDDGTGTTAVLCLAEHFAAQPEPTRRSLVFVCFSAEEKGLRGSRAFCESPPLPLDHIAAVINLEMLGRPEREAPPFAWITGAALSDFAAIAKPALGRAGVELTEFPMAARLFFASDNLPFAERGVVAHSISAGTLHEDYHQPGDQSERIAVPHMTAVIRGVAEVVAEFANRDPRPEFTDDARRQLERGR